MIRIFCFVCLLLVGRFCYFSEPYGVSVDESTYLSLAEILHHGGVLYRDAVDRKPPGFIWLYQLIGKTFGDWNIHAVHFLFFVILLALIGMAGAILLEVTRSSRIAVLGMFIFGLSSSSFPREIVSANAELPMLLLLSLSLWAFLKFAESGRFAWLFLSVIMAVVSTLFKQYGALVFIPIYLAWVWLSRRDKLTFWSRQLTGLFVSLLAVFLVYGSTYFYFETYGAAKEFLYYFLTDGLKYVGQSRDIRNHSTSIWIAVGAMLVSWPVLWWGFIRFVREPFDSNKHFIFCGALGALLTIFLSGRYYTHYFIPAVWFFSLVAAMGLETLWPAKKNFILALVLIPFCFYAVFDFNRELISRGWSFTKEKQIDMKVVSEYVKSVTSSEDRILVWGMASQIYVMSDRGSGSRFVFSDFVSGRQPGYKSDISVPLPNAAREFLTDLDRQRPRIIVDTSSARLNDYQWFPISRFPEIYSYVTTHYQHQMDIQGFQIWVLKS